MPYLLLEEAGLPGPAAVSVNGLPIARATALRPGDCIRAAGAILRYCEPSADASIVAEPRGGYRAEPTGPRRGLDPIDRRPELARSPELVAEAPCMRRLLAQVRKVSAGESNVLLLGESGTGKEVIAQAIRASGPRAGCPYVALNAAALPENVLESELFGHERGAFTGATARRIGVFELASGGTLFLDEVGELATTIQAKLLRVLETGEIRRLGGAETIRVDVRLIAATNRDLRREVKDRAFREDLFYRIAVLELRVPPLRERPEDLEPLARQLLERLAREGRRPPLTLAPQALARLRGYAFPGNVRELRNLLEAAVNFCEREEIGLEDLPPHVLRPVRVESEFPALATVERDHIEAALRRVQWNKSRAAALLGIDRKTLYGKIETYGLKPSLPPAAEETAVERVSSTE